MNEIKTCFNQFSSILIYLQMYFCYLKNVYSLLKIMKRWPRQNQSFTTTPLLHFFFVECTVGQGQYPCL